MNATLIKCGRNVTTTPHWHLSTAQVRACYNGENPPSYTREGTLTGRPTPTPTPTRNVTPPQAKYYNDLTTDLGLPNLLATFDGWTISSELDRLKDLRLKRNERDRLAKLAAKTTPTPTAAPVADGIYVLNNRYYKVLHAVHGSGRQYAQVFNTVTRKFTKAAGALYHLRPEHAVTTEQARSFGRLYGKCVFCSLPLTDDRSIFAGYGETCAGNRNLPWGAYPDYNAPTATP